MMSPAAKVWLNDELVPAAAARISVQDRGFLYGDGFFETLRAENAGALTGRTACSGCFRPTGWQTGWLR